MTQLKLLGAQRIKALISMLADKRLEEIRGIEKEAMSRDEATAIAAKNHGISDELSEVATIRKRIEELNIALSPYGYSLALNTSTSTYNKPLAAKYFAEVTKEQFGDRDAKIAEINEKYKRKEQELWLCDTLDQAKEIVGIVTVPEEEK